MVTLMYQSVPSIPPPWATPWHLTKINKLMLVGQGFDLGRAFELKINKQLMQIDLSDLTIFH